jgi:predicted ATPase
MIRPYESAMQEPEAYRIGGELLLREATADAVAAEAAFRKSLEVARAQKAKSWELRTALRYARLMQGQNRTLEARALLSHIYDWFTEGFDTKDRVEAKALLEELRR